MKNLQKKNKEKGIKFENKVRKTIMSGGLPTDPLDLAYDGKAIEVKITDQKSYRITLKLLEKMWEQSLNAQKIPYLIIGIPRNDRELFMLHVNISIKRR